MDEKLVAWGRAVNSRRRQRGLRSGVQAAPAGWAPPLWLFTDAARMGDVRAAVEGLPKGLCGVVLRHDGTGGRDILAREVWRICRDRRLALVVAGATWVPGGAGGHFRGGRGAGGRIDRARSTASAHAMAELVQARHRRVGAVFLSPVFPTVSHPGQASLGLMRWLGLAKRSGMAVDGRIYALGGMDGVGARRLPRWAGGVGAIGALVAQ